MGNKEIILKSTLSHNIEPLWLKISNLQYEWKFALNISKTGYTVIIINDTILLKPNINFKTLSQRDGYGLISVSTNTKLQTDLFSISEIKFTFLSTEIKKMTFFYPHARTHFKAMSARDNEFISSKFLCVRGSIYKICMTSLFYFKIYSSQISSWPLLPPGSFPICFTAGALLAFQLNHNHLNNHSLGEPGSPKNFWTQGKPVRIISGFPSGCQRGQITQPRRTRELILHVVNFDQ